MFGYCAHLPRASFIHSSHRNSCSFFHSLFFIINCNRAAECARANAFFSVYCPESFIFFLFVDFLIFTCLFTFRMGFYYLNGRNISRGNNFNGKMCKRFFFSVGFEHFANNCDFINKLTISIKWENCHCILFPEDFLFFSFFICIPFHSVWTAAAAA